MIPNTFDAPFTSKQSNRFQAPSGASGFTLIEMAIAIAVIGLMLGSILVPLSRQVEQRQIATTRAALGEIREALLGFAVAKGYLPCPAVSATNGQEDRTAGACTGGKRFGFIPWQTLGVAKLDAWGHIFEYSMTPAFASAFNLATTPDMKIQDRDSSGTLTNITNVNTVVAVILSAGKNGYGAYNDQGVAQASPTGWPASYPDENTNATGTTVAAGTTIFISRNQQDQGATGAGGEFDDIVVSLPAVTLFQRMVAAKILP